jgi:Na+/H+ antiporter NhaD/arsenite permease-like protein
MIKNKILSIDLRMCNVTGIETYISNLVPLIIYSYQDVKFNLLEDINIT